MAAVTLAVLMENDYLGFDFAEEMVATAEVGDVVTLTYDFGDGLRKIVGTFEGRETRESGEVFVWVREQDKTQTRYAIPMGMVEGLRVEARAGTLPVAPRPEAHTPEPPAPAPAGNRKRRARRRYDSTVHSGASEFGRSCARIDYDGQVD